MGSGRLLAVAAYGVAQFFDDRLQAARVVATLAGALTLLFTTLLASRLFGAVAAVIAGALYILSPFAVVYDRLALSDGFLAASLSGLMLAGLELFRAPESSLRRGMVGLCILLAIVSKVSAVLFLLTLPLGALLVARKKDGAFRSTAIAGLLGLLLASPMLWFFWKNRGEIGDQHIIDPMISGSIVSATLRDMSDWATAYFTPATLVAALVSLAVLRNASALWLACSTVLPFCLFALFSQPWSARYVLPTLSPLLVLVAGGIATLVSRQTRSPGFPPALGLALLASCQAVGFDAALFSDPSSAPFPRDDRTQLVTGWPAGYGVRELARRLQSEAAAKPVAALVDAGGLRTIPSGLAVLLGARSNVRLIEGDFGSAEFQDGARKRDRSVLAVIGPRSDGFDFKLQWRDLNPERLEVYVRPGGEWAVTLFRIGANRE